MVDIELLTAYRNTEFKVFTPSICIKVDQSNADLDKLLSQFDKNEWAYITAYNPYSQVLSDEENCSRHLQLIHEASIYNCFGGEGVGEDPRWKPETSLLIIGITKTDAIQMGNRFEQNAIVTGTINSPAQLLVLVTNEL